MFKKYRVLKWSITIILVLAAIVFSFGYWFMGLIPPIDPQLKTTQVQDLSYLTNDPVSKRGKILTIVTSIDTMGNSGKKTGYELTELSRAYYVFKANGFDVDVASPQGGNAPMVIDNEDMGVYDYAFLNDSVAINKVENTIAIQDVVIEDYKAVFFAGGKGAMYDFPNNEVIKRLVKEYYQSNKVVGAVCHGPAALVNVKLDNGKYLLENKKVSGFTNKEELLLISDAKTIFPFLLQDELTAQGAQYEEGEMYLEQVSHDQNLITGQNPWSTWKVAETMIAQMGYVPKKRIITAEENAEAVLSTYRTEGKKKAKGLIVRLSKGEQKEIKRVLIAKHAIVAAMKGELGHFRNMVSLTATAKKYAADN